MLKLIAVETSDVVGSTSMPADNLKLAMVTLKKYLNSVQQEQDTVVEFFRGDAFQIMYPNALYSLRNLLLVKLHMYHSLDFPVYITQSLALGYVDKPVITLNDRMDEVFINSGRQLDNVNKCELGIFMTQFTTASYLCLSFFNRILQGLSTRQAEVLYWYIKLDYPEHKKIASILDMSRQNVNTHLLRANADLIKSFITYFENTTKEHQK
jgi:DNA-binding CsgD family transcriptional regulator